MIHVVCCVRDSAVNGFMRPFFVPSALAAVRGFKDEVLRPESDMGKHPADYELFEIAHWDDEGAVFTPVSPAVLLFRAQDVRFAAPQPL